MPGTYRGSSTLSPKWYILWAVKEFAMADSFGETYDIIMADRSYKTNPFSMCCYVAAGLIIYFLRSRIGDAPTVAGKFFVALKISALAMTVASVGGAVSKLDKHLIQRRRNIFAAQILRYLRQGKPLRPGRDDYVVYLRPFFTTGQMPLENPSRRFLRIFPVMPHYFVRRYEPPASDLEAVIVLLVERLGKLIAIGQPGEQVGSGRVASDDDCWRDDVAMLIERARLLVMIPSERPGTSWEMQFVRNCGHLGKCLFL